MKLVFP